MIALVLFLASGCGGDEDSEGGDADIDMDADLDSDSDADIYDGARSYCVDVINSYRDTLGLAHYARWADAEPCADGEARSDSETGTAHGAFPSCEEFGQNECPSWPGPPESLIDSCLASMWAEGPGDDFDAHGHYINMSSTAYTEVACGFYETPGGGYWAVQDFR
jgi:hypothetical protein